jgi:hypothetical protein
MKRRDFLKGLAAVPLAAALPLAAVAEASKPLMYCMDASGGPDRTVAWMVRWCPITETILNEPISADEFYADF